MITQYAKFYFYTSFHLHKPVKSSISSHIDSNYATVPWEPTWTLALAKGLCTEFFANKYLAISFPSILV